MATFAPGVTTNREERDPLLRKPKGSLGRDRDRAPVEAGAPNVASFAPTPHLCTCVHVWAARVDGREVGKHPRTVPSKVFHMFLQGSRWIDWNSAITVR